MMNSIRRLGSLRKTDERESSGRDSGTGNSTGSGGGSMDSFQFMSESFDDGNNLGEAVSPMEVEKGRLGDDGGDFVQKGTHRSSFIFRRPRVYAPLLFLLFLSIVLLTVLVATASSRRAIADEERGSLTSTASLIQEPPQNNVVSEVVSPAATEEEEEEVEVEIVSNPETVEDVSSVSPSAYVVVDTTSTEAKPVMGNFEVSVSMRPSASVVVTSAPVVSASEAPSSVPVVSSSVYPSVDGSNIPTVTVTVDPTVDHTFVPTVDHTLDPVVSHSMFPTISLTSLPTSAKADPLTFELAGMLTDPNDPSMGHSVALSEDGMHLAIGIPGLGNGDVQTFERQASLNGFEWVKYGRLDEHPRLTRFGTKVQLSANGQRLCVLSLYTDFFGGTDTYVIVYGYNRMVDRWSVVFQLGENGYGLDDTAVAFSGDGGTIAIGSYDSWRGNRIMVYSSGPQVNFEVDSADAFRDESIAFDRSGHRMAYHDGGEIFVWDFVDTFGNLDLGLLDYWERTTEPIPIAPYDGSDTDEGRHVAVLLSEDGAHLTVATPERVQLYTNVTTLTQRIWVPFGRPLLLYQNRFVPSSVSLSKAPKRKGSGSGSASAMAIPSDPNSFDEFEYILAVTTVGVDPPNDRNVRLFRLDGERNSQIPGSWLPTDVVFEGKNLPRGYGQSISLSSDGTTIAIGAPTVTTAEEDTESASLLFEAPGVVFVYSLD